MLDKYKDYIESEITADDYKYISELFSNNIKEELPHLDTKQWKSLNSKYNKTLIREALIIYILENKCRFPYKAIKSSEVNTLFKKLRSKNHKSFVSTNKIKNIEGIELGAMYKYKFIDDEHDFDKEGKLIIDVRHQYNRGSDYFQQINRYNCGTWQKDNPIISWNSWKGLKSILGVLWRLGNDRLEKNKYVEAVRLGLYNATQFKPPVAKTIYDMFKGKRVLDISCGWGDRLFGFYTSKSEEYYGFDPNPDTYLEYKNQCIEYERILGNKCIIEDNGDNFVCKGEKTVRIWNLPAEDVDYSLIPEIDIVFSSPPYFATEKYAESGDCDKQSWFRYKEHKNWQEGFLHNVLNKCKSVLSKDGIIAINIIDGSIKGERQHICSPMIDYVNDKLDVTYKGQIGMVMSQRPNTAVQRMIKKKSNETNEEYTRRVADIEKKIVNEVPFIEPIFVFTNSDITLDETLIQTKKNVDDLFE